MHKPSFRLYAQRLDERGVVGDQPDTSYADEEVFNYFLHLFQNRPKLMAQSSNIEDVLSRYDRDENAPKRDDIEKVKQIAKKARERAREEVGAPPLPSPEPPRQEAPRREVPRSAELHGSPDDASLDEPEDYHGRIWGGADLTPAQVRRVKKLLKSGWNSARISARTGLPEDSINQLQRRDVSAGRRLTQNQRKEIASLARQDMTPGEIAFHLDVPVWVVERLTGKKQSQATYQPPPDDDRPRTDWDNDELAQRMNARRAWDKPELADPGEDVAMRKGYDQDYNRKQVFNRDRYEKNKAWPPPEKEVATAPLFGTSKDVNPLRDKTWQHYSAGRNFKPTPEQLQQARQMKQQHPDWTDQAIALSLKIPRHVARDA